MDGPNEILHLQFSPDQRYITSEPPHENPMSNGNTWQSWDVPGRPEAVWGIGIGIIIDPLDGDSEVTFMSAGAEFVLD
jgi:hypothetical protein